MYEYSDEYICTNCPYGTICDDSNIIKCHGDRYLNRLTGNCIKCPNNAKCDGTNISCNSDKKLVVKDSKLYCI